MPLSLLNHSALALFAQRTRIPTSARSIGFCAIWVCISSSSSTCCSPIIQIIHPVPGGEVVKHPSTCMLFFFLFCSFCLSSVVSCQCILENNFGSNLGSSYFTAALRESRVHRIKDSSRQKIFANRCSPSMSSNAFIVVVQKANDVLNADGMMGTSDPYAKVSSPTAPAMLNVATHVVQNSLNPVWDTGVLFTLPTSVPAMIKVDVFDSDVGTLVDGSDVSFARSTRA